MIRSRLCLGVLALLGTQLPSGMAAPRASRNGVRGSDKARERAAAENDPFLEEEEPDTVERQPRRRLKTKQKLGKTSKKIPERGSGGGEGNNLRRMVLHCRKSLDLEACWNDVSLLGMDQLRKVHDLRGPHSLAVEGDVPAMKNLSRLGYQLTEDSERRTLTIEDSLERHRMLDSSQQQAIGYGVDMVRATEVWSKYEAKGDGVKVCVMDTGVVAEHPDFSGSHLLGWNSTADFVVPWYEDQAGHGTHVTGIIAASDNDRGYVGVAPGVEVYFVRVFTDDSRFYGSDVVAAAEACRDAGSDIISMSLGGLGYDRGEDEVFRDLYENDGIIAVASAGNTGGPERIYPAGYEHVVSVGACDENKNMAPFSSFNSFVDVIAPGVRIPSTYPSLGDEVESYASLTGTSQAGPHVAGILALMKSYAPWASADELLTALRQSTQPLTTRVGLGLVDALAAVEMLENGFNVTTFAEPSCRPVSLQLDTDRWGEETAYRLRRLSDRTVLWKARGLYSRMRYLENTCVDPNDCYEFTIKDTYGDGIIAPGRLLLSYDGQAEIEGGSFGRGERVYFGDGC